MNLLFLGPPGSGKGTQAIRLAETKGLSHISTGDLLREAVKVGTELGKQVEDYMKRGDLVPDDLIIGLIKDKVSSGEIGAGFILDGFPRTIPQAEGLKEMFATGNISLDKAVLLDVPDEEIVKRLSGRWFCPKCNEGYNYPARMPEKAGLCDHDGEKLQRRPDDEESVVRNRLEVYKAQTAPIIGFYKAESILTSVEANQTPDAVFAEILKAIG